MSRSRAKNGRAKGSILRYTGPVRLPTYGGLDDSSIKVNLSCSAAATASTGSIISGFIDTAGVTTLATDWTGFAAVYQEYRVLGIRLEYVNKFNSAYNATVTPSEGLMATNHTSTISTPTSYDQLVQVADHKAFRTGAPLVMEWRARGVEEMNFTSTSSSTVHGGIQWYVPFCSASVTYGTFKITYLVEFRARK